MSLTWHASEANAKASSSAITTSTVYDKLYARLNFNDNDVRAVYIDWGDGDDRLRDKKANYQWKTFDNPVSGAVIEHTYTATGADYTPIIQTVNSEGFVSRYHMDGSNPDSLQLQPFTTNTSITGMAVTDGQATGIMRVENQIVKDGIDNSILLNDGPADIKMMIPPLLNTTELGYLTDGDTGVTLRVTAEVIDSMISETGTTVGVGGGKEIRTFSVTLSGTSLTGTTASQADGLKNINAPTDGKQIVRVLEIRFDNPKYVGQDTTSSRVDDYTKNEIYNRLKLYVVVEGKDGYFHPIGYVSAGCPIKKANDSERYITMDMSQSRAKASNKSNAFYRFDEGKAWFEQANRHLNNTWTAVTGSTAGVYEFFGDNTKRTSSTHQVSYTYGDMCRPDGLAGQQLIGGKRADAFSESNSAKFYTNGTTTASQKFRTDQFMITEFGNFVDQYHLVRCSVQPSSATNGVDTEVSSIIANKPYVFRITPALNWADSSSSVFIDNSQTGNETANYTEYADNNINGRTLKTSAITNTGLVSLSGMNNQTYTFPDGTSRTAPPKEYLLMLFSKKTNKIFFNINNYSNLLMNQNLSGNSFGTTAAYPAWDIAGVSYLKLENSGTITQNAEWIPVPFEDTTSVSLEYRDTTNKKYTQQNNSLSRSGYVSFDMPLDWSATTMKNLCGGALAVSAATSGTSDIKVTGTAGTSADSPAPAIGKYNPITLDTASTALIQGTHELDKYKIGNWKYAFICTSSTGGGGENHMYWLGSGASTDNYGYVSGTDNGSTPGKMVVHFGEEPSGGDLEPKGTVKGYLRRVNVYDIIDGFNKLYKGTSATKLIPTQGDTTWENEWMIETTGSGVGEALLDAWKDNELYALKITLSGNISDNATDQEVYAYPQVWNIFDATESHCSIIKSIDDSAYNLNSLAITSDLSMSRSGQYLSTITKKGKVYLQKTGVGLESIGFSSVALGDENSSSVFADHGYSTLYGHLHMARKLQGQGHSVYWDEVQKDGTYIRVWGLISNLVENRATGGPTAIKSYNFNMMVSKVALLNADGKLMTDIFPLGGIESEPSYASN